ncbi:ParB/RepB/Spo0J family partition protein [Candidatus Rariloculus sp.]|uniref:ParB/RepB/Spo0J family partition protein n=1 Tax=Candidatus Rariloculus sp. TaxID=3101265 RepID=UPI003D0F6E45
MAKRRSLGRGLDTLLSTSSWQRPAASGAEFREMPIDLIARGRYQPRVDMREETLAELAESIRAQGIVQPIVVRPVGAGGSGETRYEIVAGERRWRAAQMAGLDTVPALVREIPDEAAVAVALIENIQRENLNPIEEARALKQLVTDFGMTHVRVSEAIGRSRAAVSNLLRLLDLPEAVTRLLERRELDMGHARALLPVTPAERLVEIARRIVREGWSVRQTERAVQKLAERRERGAGKAASRRKDPNVTRLQDELGETLGAPVSIEHGTKGGRVVIRYHSLDELEGILAHIK